MLIRPAGSLAYCAVLVATSSIAVANDAAIKAGIVKLLDAGWSVAPSARAAADAQYTELATVAPGNVHLLSASSLVLLQQRRYDEAGKRLDELLEVDPKNLLGLRARCWLATTLKNYGAAILFAEKLRAALPAESTQDLAAEAAAREQLAFLGRLCGYLAGPAADGVDQDSRKALEKTILAGLGEERKVVFETARDGVTQKFFELTDTKVETEKKNTEERTLEAAQTLQDVENLRKAIDDRVKELNELAKKIQGEWNDELAEIMNLDRPLVAQLARLQARANILNRDLVAYQSRINGLEALLFRERDPRVRNQIDRDIDNLTFLAARVSGELEIVNREGQAVEAQRAALAARTARAQANFGGQLDRINKELAELGKREKRADYEEKKAKRPVSSSSTKTIALASQATALSTYDKFPLEQAKQRLLEELK
jgi:predicted  nucleic acid-binding Zn-ribbon protein